MKFKLGKKPFKYDPRTLQFHKYATELGSLPPAPAEIHWPSPPTIGMLMNDTLGDCAIAGPLHQEEIWRFANGIDYLPTDEDALDAYEQIGGYNPADPTTDGGCILLDVMKAWRTNGIAGRKIGAFVQVNAKNIDHVKQSIYLFGGVIVGWALPACLDENSKMWIPPASGLTGSGTPGSLGGHCTDLSGYDSNGVDNITWGEKIGASWSFFQDYIDEVWAAISMDWIVNPQKAPNGLNMQQLLYDLNQVTK